MGPRRWWEMSPRSFKPPENHHLNDVQLERQQTSDWRVGPTCQSVRYQYIQSRPHDALPSPHIVPSNVGEFEMYLSSYTAYELNLFCQPDETHIAAGMSDGTLSVRRRQIKASEGTSDLLGDAILRSGAFESFLGSLPALGQGRVKSKQKSRPMGDVDELRVETKRKRRLREYDRLLKNFKYSAALDSVLRKVGEYQPFFKVPLIMVRYSKSRRRRRSR